MKDFSYLQAFSISVLKGARMILEKGFTIEDINEFLGRPRVPEVPITPERRRQRIENMRKMGWELKKPCGGCKDKKKEVI